MLLLIAALAFVLLGTITVSRCKVLGHTWTEIIPGETRLIEHKEGSFKWMQLSKKFCMLCKTEEEFYRINEFSFEKSSYTSWKPIDTGVKLKFVTLPIINFKGKTMELADFFEFSKLYEQFRQKLGNHSIDSCQQLLEKENFAQVAENHAKEFRKTQVDLILQTVKQGIDEFKKSLAEKLITAVAKQNPYSVWANQKLQVFPPNCRFWFCGNSSVVVVVEEQPQLRTIRCAERFGKSSYYLAMPYVIFVMVFQNVGNDSDGNILWHLYQLHTGVRTSPLSTMQDPLYELPLPDINHTRVCMGVWTNPTGPIEKQVCDAVTYFWGSRFVPEWMENVQRNTLWPLERWEELSRKDPLFFLKYHWVKTKSVFDILAELAASEKVPGLLNAPQQTKEVQDAVANCWHLIQDSISPMSARIEHAFIRACIDRCPHVLHQIISMALASIDETVKKRIEK